MDKCLECNQQFETEAGLHRHLRSHKISSTVYYQKHFPRYDKYDNSLIKFKNKEYYFDTDFNSRENLRLWLDKSDKETAKAYLINYLKKRKLQKNLVYAPTQVELRSLPLGAIKYFNDIFGSYYDLCESLGFKLKFTELGFEKLPKDIGDCTIIIDTREQLPLKFSLNTRVETLPFGDYKLEPDVTCGCYIERKSLADFYGTMTAGFDRFKREVAKSQEAGANLIVLIESRFETVAKFPLQRQVYGKIKMPPECVFHSMREIIQEFPNTQFLFVNGRLVASQVIERIFASHCEYKNIDLQYAYDTAQL